MKNILILFAHPRFEQSRCHAVLVDHIPDQPNIIFHDLYEEYPDFNIDIDREKELLSKSHIAIMQHPFYWYSAPPLIKQWIDLVLEFEWAYGPGGTALQGKILFNAISSGGNREAYGPEGRNRYTVRQFLAPFEQTARLCHMSYLPPFAVQGTHRLNTVEMKEKGRKYNRLLKLLSSGNYHKEDMENLAYLNDWIELKEKSEA